MNKQQLNVGDLVETRVRNDSSSNRRGEIKKVKFPYFDVDVGTPYGVGSWVICEHKNYLKRV